MTRDKLVERMKTEFVRFETEDKLILQGLIYRPETETKKAFLHVHGMGGNFYENRFLDFMAKGITSSSYAFFSINTRGHDLIADFPIAGGNEKYKRIGDAYEKFEECLLDIKPAVDFLENNGFEEIVLCGHSLGSVKAVYYIVKTQDSRVKKLVLMSPPDMVGLAEQGSDHNDLLSQAQKMVEEGRGEELLPKKIWDWYLRHAQPHVGVDAVGLGDAGH